jgi:hypothetical protein
MVFPTSPTVGQVFSSGGRSWVWNGATWDSPRTDNPPLAIPTGNVIINGGFDIWQRGASGFALGGGMTADRWRFYTSNGTNKAVTRQSFTPGDLNVPSFGESDFFWRFSETGATVADENTTYTAIEDVKTLAGQTVTVSYWAKSSVSGSTVNPNFVQRFGSGGSAAVSTLGASRSITTSWARYTETFNLPSIAGRTIGSGNHLQFGLSFRTNFVQTVDIWGVQLEAGAVATPFRRNAPSIQAELAACQRYYQKSYNVDTAPGSSTDVGAVQFTGSTNGGGNTSTPVTFRVQMRATPSMAFWTPGGTANAWDYERSGASGNLTAFTSGLGTSGLRVALSLGVGFTSCGAYGHWVATAEL